ncbi:hypothetical protein, partial [Mesorhizobium sp.]|uniref:hypothetical protein n=1 Tax=Mesorhizobium sp. TaxID=1871066 RepID=UPI0025C1B0BB
TTVTFARTSGRRRLLAAGIAVLDDPSDGSKYLFHGRFALRAARCRHRHIRRLCDLFKISIPARPEFESMRTA